jgi:hypothetical protein
MIDRSLPFRPLLRAAAMTSLLVLGIQLGGCAGVGDSFLSGAFVEPSKYEQFDCKQLEAERSRLELRAAELQGLIDKARSGTAGTVVGEAVYRNDYISARASSKLAEEAWVKGKCVASPTVVATPEPGSKPAASKRGSARH